MTPRLLALPCLALMACSDPPVRVLATAPALTTASADPSEALHGRLVATNAGLRAIGAPYRAVMAEYLTTAGEGGAQTVILRELGNRHLTANFVPRDPRRTGWSGLFGSTDDLSYALDETADATPPGGLVSGTQANQAILRAIGAWDAEQCSEIPLVRNPDFGLDVGYIAFIGSGGSNGSAAILGDVHHAGFTDFDFGAGVLAATFTLVFIGNDGQPTDVNGDGKADVAFREVYYSSSATWESGSGIDVESVALHEHGHSISQAHFGTVSVRNDGSLTASPRAVMNGAYLAPLTKLTGTDRAGHCSLWAAWPIR